MLVFTSRIKVLTISRMIMLYLQAGLKQDDSARVYEQGEVLCISRMIMFLSRVRVLSISRMIVLRLMSRAESA